MNNTQIAKVVHEAHRALGETTGEAPQEKWEDLTEHQKIVQTGDVNAHTTGIRRGVDTDQVVKQLPHKDRLKAFLTHGIVNAFHRHEKLLAGGNALDTHTASEEAQLHQTTSIDTVRANNTLARANATAQPSNGPTTIDEAMAKADKSAAEANAVNENPANEGSGQTEDSSR